MGPPLTAHYPHFLSVPGFVKPADGVALAEAFLREMRRLEQEEGFVPDLIDAHLAFPDGFAAALVAKWTGLPFTITLRGHDINDLPRFPVRWAQVKYALSKADRVIGVCRALVDGAIDAGMDPAKGVAIANGVDPVRFAPIDKVAARKALGLPLDVPLVVSVGHMVERKGFHILVDALDQLKQRGRDDVHMVFVGGAGEEGDFVQQVREKVSSAGLTERVHFTGAVVNTELPRYYSAADVFALATAKEGWPNVLFESLACGTPPVITEVWGTPECLCRPEFGVLVKERTGAAFADGLAKALDTDWDSDLLVRYARANTWATVGRRTVTEFERTMGVRAGVSQAQLDADLGPAPVGPKLPEAEQAHGTGEEA